MITFRSLGWVVSEVTFTRLTTKNSYSTDPAITVTLAFGNKETTPSGEVVKGEFGEDLFQEPMFLKTFTGSKKNIAEFMGNVALNPGFAYKGTWPTSITNPWDVDSAIKGMVENFTQWMLDTGKWRV